MAVLVTNEEDARDERPRMLPSKSNAVTIHSVRFMTSMREANELGFDFVSLVTEGLISTIGETSGYAVLACARKGALEDPAKFADVIVSLFGLSGRTILNGLGEFVQNKVSHRQAGTQ